MKLPQGFVYIKDFENLYAISKDGYVFSMRANKIMKTSIAPKGYRRLLLQVNKKIIGVSPHRLVATTFIPNPEGKSEVNHKDADKLNNHISNLEWCTPQENMSHAKGMGLCLAAQRHRASLDKLQTEEVRELYRTGLTQMGIAKKLKVNQTTISKVLRREGAYGEANY